MRVLAGDIGGTKTSVAIVDIGPRLLSVGRHARYPSADYASLEHLLAEFLAGEHHLPAAAAFGVAPGGCARALCSRAARARRPRPHPLGDCV